MIIRADFNHTQQIDELKCFIKKHKLHSDYQHKGEPYLLSFRNKEELG